MLRRDLRCLDAAYFSGALWNRDIETIQGRKLKGIAIRCTDG